MSATIEVECQHGPICERCSCSHPYWECPECGEEYDEKTGSDEHNVQLTCSCGAEIVLLMGGLD